MDSFDHGKLSGGFWDPLEDRLYPVRHKQLGETAQTSQVPTTKPLEWPDEGSMSASSTLSQDYPRASPQHIDMSHTSDVFRDRRGDYPPARQTQQTPLMSETQIGLTNHVADWKLGTEVKVPANEKAAASLPGTWQLASPVDPSYEPIISSAEDLQNHMLLPPSVEMGTIRDLDLSRPSDQSQELMTGTVLQRPGQTLSSTAVYNYTLPLPPTLSESGLDQVSSTRRDQTMVQRASHRTIANELSYTPINRYASYHELGSREQGPPAERECAQPMNDLLEPQVADTGLNSNHTMHVPSTTANNHHAPFANISGGNSHVLAKRPNGRALEHGGPDRKRQKLGTRRTCMKCIIDRKFCDFMEDLNMCQRCAYGFKGFRPLCSFTKVVDINLFRLHTDPNVPLPELGIDEAVIGRIEGRNRAGARTIGITQGYGEKLLEFGIQEFDKSTINLEEIPETEQNLYSVPFAIADLEQATKKTQKFIMLSIRPYIKAKLAEGDEISKLFFDLATQIATGSTPHSHFLSKVLYFWTAARMIEGDWSIRRTETHELPQDSVIYDAPFIDYQFSGIIKDQILLPLQKNVLKKLNDMISKDHKKNWLSIFVGTFVLLNTYELLMKQQKEFSQSIGFKTGYSSMELVRGILHGANVLLQHFHAIKGQKPFNDILRQGWEDQEVPRAAGYQGSHMLRRLAVLVKEQGQKFEELAKTNKYEENYWFTGQLFLPGWKPPNTIQDAPSENEAR